MSVRGPRAERIRVRGLVQGVGFRPTVWRLARELGLGGDVRNDGEGVLIQVRGDEAALDAFCQRLVSECPVLARIDSLERHPWPEGLAAPASTLTSVSVPLASSTVITP
ncbi:MAG TPA: acylphosphatase, partial [Chromatiaceae bacterium]|nr:acylphosphatase [Chromatiaceae bacterium]